MEVLKIIFVNRYFYPDHSATSQMLSDLAFFLENAGIHTAVVTSSRQVDPDRFQINYGYRLLKREIEAFRSGFQLGMLTDLQKEVRPGRGLRGSCGWLSRIQ